VKLILASRSPRRRDLLATIVGEFEVVPSEIDETLEGGPTPEAVAALALRKARAVAARVADATVLGADTVVVLDGEALGKPGGPAEARAMLRRLRGREHEVITGIAVVDVRRRREAARAVVSRVTMAAYSDATIEAYVASGAPLDKAGAYAIQDLGGALVERCAGSYTNVVGLPVEETRRLLEEVGVPVSAPPAP
jgi:septum formation protein